MTRHHPTSDINSAKVGKPWSGGTKIKTKQETNKQVLENCGDIYDGSK